MRAQTTLPAIGLAFLVLTSVCVLGVAVANGALASADRQSLDRQAAAALSERLVDADTALTVRANVLDARSLANLSAGTLRRQYGLPSGTQARISLDGKTVATTGDADGGVTLSRLVLVRERRSRTITPTFAGGNRVTLPRRTARAELAVRPQPNVTVTTVRANGRVVLHNGSGLDGQHTVRVSRRRTVEFRFGATARLSRGAVTVTYYPVETRKARLEVTVDG